VISLLWAVTLAGSAAERLPEDSGPSDPVVDYAVVVTGGELLRGVYPDGHTSFITRTLEPLGCRCVGSMCVDDRREDLLEALRFASARAPLVIVTGGLGPTANDITRETLSTFTGIPLREHPEVLAELGRRFNQPEDQLRANLRRQTQVPERGGYLENPQGTAVGLVFDDGRRVIVALPGPPRELQPMVRTELLPLLQKRFGVHSLGCSLTLRFVGVGQSAIDQTIRERGQLPSDVIVTSLFEGARVDFTFSLPKDTPPDRTRLREVADRLRRAMPDAIYAEGNQTLEQVVAARLLANHITLALAEVGSGGALAASLSRLPGADRFLTGAFVAPSEGQLLRLLRRSQTENAATNALSPEERLRQLADSVRTLTAADCVVVVGDADTTTPKSPVLWVAIQRPGLVCEVRKLVLRDSVEAGRAHLVTEILNRLR
jgi:nicotinamide-nucleotide amidase